jgi:molybdate transport system substrate-binding protein
MFTSLRNHALALGIVACLLHPVSCLAGDLMVLATVDEMEVLEELAPAYEKLSGQRVHLYLTTADALRPPLLAAARFDVAILPASMVSAARRANQLTPDGHVDIARYGMGIAAKAGAAPAPVRNAAQLRDLLLGAGTIAVAREGACGDRFLLLLENLGIAEQVAPRLIETDASGNAPGALVAAGRADLAIAPAREIAALKGVSLLAPWPPEVQCYETIAGAVSARSRQPAAARAFLRFVTSERAAIALRAHGQEPVTAAKRQN